MVMQLLPDFSINSNRITTFGRELGLHSYNVIKVFYATKCIIYTDVEGVMTTDPRVYKKKKN